MTLESSEVLDHIFHTFDELIIPAMAAWVIAILRHLLIHVVGRQPPSGGSSHKP